MIALVDTAKDPSRPNPRSPVPMDVEPLPHASPPKGKVSSPNASDTDSGGGFDTRSNFSIDANSTASAEKVIDVILIEDEEPLVSWRFADYHGRVYPSDSPSGWEAEVQCWIEVNFKAQAAPIAEWR